MMKKFLLILIFTSLFFTTKRFPQTVHHLGVNVPWRSTEIGMTTTFPLLDELGVKFYRHMMYSDVGWAHIEPQNDEWHFEFADSAMFNPYGITPLPTLYHCCNASDTIGLQVPWRACFEDTCGWYFRDSVYSKDYVQTVVNRYKSRTKYWEISNELDGNQRRPRGLPARIVADFLRLNYRWIKEADPEAQIVLPSLSGTFGMPLGQYNWLRIVLLNGGCNYFDIIGYHDYNSWWTLPAHIDSINKAMGDFGCPQKPFWNTECSISSDSTTNITPRYSTLDQQAADVWRRSAILFAYGVEKYFWHPLWSGDRRPWIDFGLTNANGIKKKSFHSFKLLVQEIDTFQTAQFISTGIVTNDNFSGGEGIWAVKYTFSNNESKWLLWSKDNQSYMLDLPEFTFVEATRTVPVYLSPDGENAIFQKDTIQVINGSVTFDLTDIPILVKGLTLDYVNTENTLLKFELSQNYPNPFNPTTTINYVIARSEATRLRLGRTTGNLANANNMTDCHVNSNKLEFTRNDRTIHVTLKIYDALGRQVATLVNKKQTPGKYSVQFNAAELPSGIYFYTLRAGKFAQTKKMVLLK